MLTCSYQGGLVIRALYTATLALALAGLPSAAASQTESLTADQISRMSLEEIEAAVRENVGIGQIVYEELQRRNPGKLPALPNRNPNVKSDPSKLTQFSDHDLQDALQALEAENDLLISRGEQLLSQAWAPDARANTSMGEPSRSSSSGATVPSGVYGCLGYTGPTLMAMGTIEIQGQTFRFAPPGGSLGAFSPYRIGTDGKIAWGGPLGALNEPPAKISESYVEEKPAYRSIIVKYQPTGSGTTFRMGCRPDVKPGH
jgi:hypothetical protein